MSSVATRLEELLNSNVCEIIDSEGYMTLLLSASMSKMFSFETEHLLKYAPLSKPSSIAMKVSSELVRCSFVPTHRDLTFVSELMSHCFHAIQSKDERTFSLKNFLVALLHAFYENEKFVGLSPDAMFDLWSALARNFEHVMTAELSTRLESILSSLFSAEDGQGAWIVYQRICSLSPTMFAEIWLNIQLETVKVNHVHGHSLLRSVLEYDCSQFSCLLNLFTSIGSDGKVATLWDSGRLDTVAATFVIQTNKQRDAKSLIADASFAEVTSTISRRFMALLISKVRE
jgi:hypothetical protein